MAVVLGVDNTYSGAAEFSKCSAYAQARKTKPGGMTSERGEEERRVAGPADERARSHPESSAGVTTEWKKNIQRHSNIYPLTTEFVPLGTIDHNPTKKLSPHTTEAGYGTKVYPSDSIRGRAGPIRSTGGGRNSAGNDKTTDSTVRTGMQAFPLRFRDAATEEAFCKHFNMYVTSKVRASSRIVTFLNVIMLGAQLLTQTQLLRDIVFLSRVAIVLLSLAFQAATFTSWFRRKFGRCVLAHYMILDLVHQLPRFAFLMNSVATEASSGKNINGELTLFASQKSVRAMNLLFILIIYIASGMRFTMASICACFHMVIKAFFAVGFCHSCAWDDLEVTTNLAMVAFCTLTAYHSERYVRQEFLERLSVNEERKRHDDLLETMLPVHIKERLKDNRTDGLAESYDEVSILFCYVNNFQTLSKHASATDLVRLMNRIVFCFDCATDVHGVYKVEAIAETYLCAAGVPQRDPFHCEKVADMALTMMRICEKESWSFNGVNIQLQIGIHSGPVVAGVVGSKTYSYHLFGDTVNTSSRICSSGCPCKIQISDRSRQLLERTGAFIISERGTMNLKGKGMVQLYWLEGKRTEPPRHKRITGLDVFSSFEAAVEESIRAKDLEFQSSMHHRSDDYLGYMNAVEIRNLTLDFQGKQARCYATEWAKSVIKPSRVQAAFDDNLAIAKLQDNHRRDNQNVTDTASDMESAYRADHNRDSTPQFCLALGMCAAYLLITIIYKVYNTDEYPNKARRDVIGYSLCGSAIILLLIIVRLLRTYPHLAKRKEAWATGTGFAFISALNVQLLTLTDTTNVSDSQPRGEQKITFLDANLLYAVMFGLVMRLRFRNAAMVNAWSFVVFAVCASVRQAESWADLSESFCLLFTAGIVATHFGYKRELGLRRDFLLKCTLHLEKQKCETLLTNMLPSKQYAEALMQQSTIVDELAEVTLLYSDMVGFTPLGAKLEPAAICVMLNQIYSAFDRHLDELGIYKMDTVGDAFIVVGGLPSYKSTKNHAAAITAFAIEMLREIERFCVEANVTLQMRIGIHTGSVVGGVVGIKKPRYLIWGRHTVIANLLESRGVAGRIQVSATTYKHLCECPEFHIEHHAHQVQIGEHDDTIQTYFLSPDHPAVKDTVILQYLEDVRILNTVDTYGLDQLCTGTCVLPSKQFKDSSASRRYSDQQSPSKAGASDSTLIPCKSFPKLLKDC